MNKVVDSGSKLWSFLFLLKLNDGNDDGDVKIDRGLRGV